MKKKLLLLLVITINLSTFGQRPNKLTEKENTARRLIKAIEANDSTEAVNLLPPHLTIKTWEYCIKNIKRAMSSIPKYSKTCKLDIVATLPNDSTVTFVCRYFNIKTEIENYELDISFNKQSDNLWINNVVIIDEKTLLKNYNARMKSTKVPPPPPQ
jgi:hypothetical protein